MEIFIIFITIFNMLYILQYIIGTIFTILYEFTPLCKEGESSETNTVRLMAVEYSKNLRCLKFKISNEHLLDGVERKAFLKEGTDIVLMVSVNEDSCGKSWN